MTYTVMARCEKTGKIGIGCTTFAPNIGRILPIVSGLLPSITETGAITAVQSFANPLLGHEAIRLINTGCSVNEVMRGLEAFGDPHLEHRQIGIVTAAGELAVRTGSGISPLLGSYCGHIVGDDYLVMVNGFVDEDQVKAMARPLEESSGEDLGERLMQALEAGRDSGGQQHPVKGKIPELSSLLQVYGEGPLAEIDLRVDFHLTAVEKLRRLLTAIKPLGHSVKLIMEDPEKYLKEPSQFMEMYHNQI